MTTFVPLAADIDGTVSAVAVGDWILNVIKLKKPDLTTEYYSEFLAQFEADGDSEDQRIGSPVRLFNLLLSQEDLVFSYLSDARKQGEITITVSATENNEPREKEIRKSYVEVHREVEEFFVVLMSMLALRFDDSEQAGKAAGALCDVFKKSHEMAEFRLKLLQLLYNVFPPTFPYRFPIFVSTLEYAAETDLFHIMVPYIKYIDEWMKDWNLSASSKRQVFLILANQLKKLGMVEEAYPYLKRHVQYFQDEKKEVLAEGATISAAVELAEDSIKLPDVMYFDSILELDAVKHLRETPHKKLVDLLEVFMRDGPKELKRFFDASGNLFQEHGLEYGQCVDKIRLLAVASLAVGKHELCMKAIGDVLQLQKEQTEETVVQAIGQGLIDAKIDQTNQKVQVKSAMQREFKRDQWEQVYERLASFSQNLQSIMGSIRQTRQSQSGAVGMHRHGNACVINGVM